MSLVHRTDGKRREVSSMSRSLTQDALRKWTESVDCSRTEAFLRQNDLLLKNVSILKEFRGIKPFSINFKNKFSVIVGENGSGKSSFFTLLTDSSFRDLIKLDVIEDTQFSFFDTEKHNPRIKNHFGKNIMFEVASRFHSHGEAILPIILFSKKIENKLILIDEPDAGISLKNQKKF